MTCIEANHIWRPEQVCPLQRSCDLYFNKNKVYHQKDPHMQNFGSIGPLVAELQTHPYQQDVQKKTDFAFPLFGHIIKLANLGQLNYKFFIKKDPAGFIGILYQRCIKINKNNYYN